MELINLILMVIGGVLIGLGNGAEDKNIGGPMIATGSVAIAMAIYRAI